LLVVQPPSFLLSFGGALWFLFSTSCPLVVQGRGHGEIFQRKRAVCLGFGELDVSRQLLSGSLISVRVGMPWVLVKKFFFFVSFRFLGVSLEMFKTPFARRVGSGFKFSLSKGERGQAFKIGNSGEVWFWMNDGYQGSKFLVQTKAGREHGVVSFPRALRVVSDTV